MLFLLWWLIFFAGVVLVTSLWRVKAMKAAAQEAGLSGIRADLFGRVSSSWRRYVVTWQMTGGGRSGPERAIVEIAVSAPARLTIYKQIAFNLNSPLNFFPFGPPVVQTAFDGEFVVRCDDVKLAERLLGDTKIIRQIHADILGWMDRLKIDTRRVRATCVARTTRDQALRAAWKLASTVVEQMGLPPASLSP